MIAFAVVFRRLFKAIRSGFADPAFRGLLQLTVVLLLVGTVFYARAEGWTLLEALYFSVITLTTVGFGDLAPTTAGTRLFTVVYILIGLGVVVALVTQIASHAARQQEQ